jgi:hypothetical protein
MSQHYTNELVRLAETVQKQAEEASQVSSGSVAEHNQRVQSFLKQAWESLSQVRLPSKIEVKYLDQLESIFESFEAHYAVGKSELGSLEPQKVPVNFSYLGKSGHKNFTRLLIKISLYLAMSNKAKKSLIEAEKKATQLDRVAPKLISYCQAFATSVSGKANPAKEK